MRPLVVIDITSDVSQGGGEYAATADDIKKYELSVRRKIKPGSIVVFRSDWSLKYDNYLTDGLPSVYPSVSLDALKFLHDERNILMHGVEPFDNDMTENKEGEAWIAHKNKCMLKGLKNLNKVPKHGCLASIGVKPVI
ncbi:hypothetical protein TrRE_jg3313 [Triparma retinervis]|uniref:Uncharacterized protein n=1 Tax=Triparma retinervis TaxID=2557542 RepID=A0A9W7FWA7_9STRA|nr:hypothetical protein TrRE_jg3313 [Triparma retinervis]